MRWREIPSMVMARDGADTIKVMLPTRFQEAIDEAAMRMGEIDADAYTAGWNRDPWTPSVNPRSCNIVPIAPSDARTACDNAS